MLVIELACHMTGACTGVQKESPSAPRMGLKGWLFTAKVLFSKPMMIENRRDQHG